MNKLIKSPFFPIIITWPILLWAITLLLPTFDDWSYLTTPYMGKIFSERMLPYGSYWRPFDHLFGCVLGWQPNWFPTLNHIFILLAHTANTYFVHCLSKYLVRNPKARYITTLFFYFSPAMLGTVLDIDSLNQAYSMFWGLLATISLVKLNAKRGILPWIIFVLLATLSKENGITYILVAPIILHLTRGASFKTMKKLFAFALCFIIAYFLIRHLLATSETQINANYFQFTWQRMLRNYGIFLGVTFFPVDFMSIVYPPQRNWLVAALTFIVACPFLFILFKNRKRLVHSTSIILVACMFITASPHLLTLFTMMHAYAALPFASLLIGFVVDKAHVSNKTILSFLLLLASFLFTDWHHWQLAYQSGLIGKEMARQVIKQSKHPANKAYIIIIDQKEPKYSMFAVPPADCFGWGRSVQNINNEQWPTTINDTTIQTHDMATITKLERKARRSNFDVVWIVMGKEVKVVDLK